MKVLSYSILLMLLTASHVFADIYKCVSKDGVVKFSDEPCSENAPVAFKTEDSKTFDESIEMGYPYPTMPMKPSLIDNNVIADHAKKIGRCIIPGEYINRVKTYESKPSGIASSISLYFGPGDQIKYRIEMRYYTFPGKNGIYVYLHSVKTFKKGRLFDPPSMLNVKKFKRKSTGRWWSNINHNFPIFNSSN